MRCFQRMEMKILDMHAYKMNLDPRLTLKCGRIISVVSMTYLRRKDLISQSQLKNCFYQIGL